MTNNIDRAAEVIGEAYQEAIDSGTPSTWRYQIARRLADAGLIAPDLPEPTMDMADPHLALWESGVSVYREVVYVPHFLPLEDLELVEQAGMDLLAAAAYVLRQKEKEETNE